MGIRSLFDIPFYHMYEITSPEAVVGTMTDVADISTRVFEFLKTDPRVQGVLQSLRNLGF